MSVFAIIAGWLASCTKWIAEYLLISRLEKIRNEKRNLETAFRTQADYAKTLADINHADDSSIDSLRNGKF